MRRFLKSWGIESKDLDKACSKLDKRKIELKDFDWLNNEELKNMSSSEFKRLKKDIIEQQKLAENFNVGMDTLARRARNG